MPERKRGGASIGDNVLAAEKNHKCKQTQENTKKKKKTFGCSVWGAMSSEGMAQQSSCPFGGRGGRGHPKGGMVVCRSWEGTVGLGSSELLQGWSLAATVAGRAQDVAYLGRAYVVRYHGATNQLVLCYLDLERWGELPQYRGGQFPSFGRRCVSFGVVGRRRRESSLF